jgi:hypothetical protein
MHPHEVRPEASRFLAEDLTLDHGGGRETTQRHEAHDTRGSALLVGHGVASLLLPTGWLIEQMCVKPGHAIHPSRESLILTHKLQLEVKRGLQRGQQDPFQGFFPGRGSGFPHPHRPDRQRLMASRGIVLGREHGDRPKAKLEDGLPGGSPVSRP